MITLLSAVTVVGAGFGAGGAERVADQVRAPRPNLFDVRSQRHRDVQRQGATAVLARRIYPFQPEKFCFLGLGPMF